MRITQFHATVMTIVFIGGQVVLGILDGGRQAVVAVSVGGIVLGHAAAYGLLDDLYAVIRVVDRLGDTIATLGRGQVLGDANEAVEVVVGIVSNRYRSGRARAGGGSSSDCRAPGFEQLAGGGVGVAAHQPLSTGLGCRANQPAIGVIRQYGLLAQRIGTGGDTALCIECLRGGVGDIGARAVDLGKITHCIIGEGGGEVELAATGIDHDCLRYVFVGRVIGGGASSIPSLIAYSSPTLPFGFNFKTLIPHRRNIKIKKETVY